MTSSHIIATAVFNSWLHQTYDIPKQPECVIDRCTIDTCTVETPEGWVVIEKKPEYHEGKSIMCPLYLIEPT